MKMIECIHRLSAFMTLAQHASVTQHDLYRLHVQHVVPNVSSDAMEDATMIMK